MKTLKNIFASLILITFATVNVNAQNPTADASADASATIIQVISIENDQELLFGNIIASAAGGTVEIATTGTPDYAGVSAPTGNEGTRQQAIFTVEGMDGATFNITLPDGPVVLTDGTNDMDVTGFTSDPEDDGVLTGGESTINVGATLNVGANQAAGLYEGSFSISVNYN